MLLKCVFATALLCSFASTQHHIQTRLAERKSIRANNITATINAASSCLIQNNRVNINGELYLKIKQGNKVTIKGKRFTIVTNGPATLNVSEYNNDEISILTVYSGTVTTSFKTKTWQVKAGERVIASDNGLLADEDQETLESDTNWLHGFAYIRPRSVPGMVKFAERYIPKKVVIAPTCNFSGRTMTGTITPGMSMMNLLQVINFSFNNAFEYKFKGDTIILQPAKR